MKYSANRISTPTGVLGGIAIGVLSMYLSDRGQGRRSSLLAADKVRSAVHHVSNDPDVMSREFGNRKPGVRDLQDRLESHQRPGSIQSLQGNGKWRHSTVGGRLSPGQNAAALLGGAALWGLGLTQYNRTAGLLLGTAGIALLLRGMREIAGQRLAATRRDRTLQ